MPSKHGVAGSSPAGEAKFMGQKAKRRAAVKRKR